MSLQQNRSSPIAPTYQKLASLRASVIIRAYITAIAAAEGIAIFVGTVPGVICHAVLIPMLLGHYMIEETRTYRHILPILALAPLLRLLSFVMPIRNTPPVFWYAFVGLPLLAAAYLTSRRLGYSRAQLGLPFKAPLYQLAISLSGLPLGLLAFFLVRPAPLVADANPFLLVVGVIILTVFVAFLEEFIFRGLLQYAVTDIFGNMGLVYSVGLYIILYLATLSIPYILLMGLVALFFSWCVQKTGSIWGPTIAHSLLAIGFLLVWPLVFS